MTWLLTSAGECMDLRVLDADKLQIDSVAYSLSHINRFTGHALRPVSVAEHSLMVCEIMERHFGITSAAALMAGLLHDAHESLTGDLSSPMKQLIGPAWIAEEHRIQRQVLQRFGMWTAFTTHHHTIQAADLHALSSEREQLMPEGGPRWPCQDFFPAIDWVQYPQPSEFTPDDWRQMFLERHAELTFAISLSHAEMNAIDGEN